MIDIEQRLRELQIDLPVPATGVASYLPYVEDSGLVFVSGQLPFRSGEVAITGRLGADLDIEQGQLAARLCAINVLAQLKQACKGDLNRIDRIVRLGGFVASIETFTAQSVVMNAASDLMVAVFGDRGTHARAAIATPVLPLNAAVEVDAVVRVQPPFTTDPKQ